MVYARSREQDKFASLLTAATVSIFMKNIAVPTVALVHPIVKLVAELLAR